MAAKPTPLRLRIILEALVVVAVAVFAVASIADVPIVVVIEVVCLRFFYGFRLVRFFVTEEKSKSQKKYETMMGLRENYVLDRQRHAACMPLSHFTSYACINLNHNSSFGSGGSVFALLFSSSSSEMKKGSFTCSWFTSSWSSTIGLSLESFAIVSANVSTPLRI